MSRSLANRTNQMPQFNQFGSQRDNRNNQIGSDLMQFGTGNDPFFSAFDEMQKQMSSNFQNMSSMMMRGSPFENILQPKSFLSRDFGVDDMFKFSDAHSQMHSMPFDRSGSMPGGGQFKSFSRSMVQKQVIGPDGKPKVERYMNDNAVQRGLDGNTISQRQQAYHSDLNGRSIVAQERMLNDQGHKQIKEKNQQGEIHDQDLYQNIDEKNASEFHNRWMNQKNQMKSLESGPSRYMQLGSQPDNRQRNTFLQPQISQGQRYQQPSLGSGYEQPRNREPLPASYSQRPSQLSSSSQQPLNQKWDQKSVPSSKGLSQQSSQSSRGSQVNSQRQPLFGTKLSNQSKKY